MRSLCTSGRLPIAVQTPNKPPSAVDEEAGSDLKFTQDLQGSFGMAISNFCGGKRVCHKTQAKKSVALESK